jgi:hypothetical protein
MFGMLAAALSSPAWAWEVPLTVADTWGQGGVHHVTGGVPLLVGQAKETTDLALVTKDAKGATVAVPAQFRVLARWWRADNSIRWVLVDFTATLGDFQVRQYSLVGGPDKPPAVLLAETVTVQETADAITVTTGPAQFVISRKRFAFLEHAYIDDNNDKEFTPAEDLLATTPDLGTVLEDTYGEKYYATEETKSVEVLERGPVRVRVRARGQHRAREGKGYSPGLYGYDVFLNFYAGSSDVNVDLVLTNNPPKSQGSPTFEDASLLMRLAGGAKGYRLYGAAPLDGELAAGESICLYQDSNGAETWERCKGHYGPQTVAFRGYRIFKRAGGKDEIIGQGDQARGITHLFNDRGGVIVHTRNFWQQFPKAVEVGADGTLRLALFPRESIVPHYFEDASGKGHEIVLNFYSRKRRTEYPSDDLARPWPHCVADVWESPAFPHPSLEHKAACGALTDVGPFSVPAFGLEGYALETNARRLFMTDRYKGNGYGWQVFGERWDSHGGHSSRGARQPIKEDNFLYRFYVTADRGWRDVGDNRARLFRDVRCYRIDDQDPFSFKDWNAFSRANRSEDYCNRPQPTSEEYRKYSQGLWNRSTWWLPNPAHMTLDLCYDRYLLFGDQRAFENLRIIGGHGGNWVAYRQPYVHRETGWSWRALERYWELTGDKDAEACLLDTLKTYEPLIGKTPLVCAGETSSADGVNWWFTQVFSRAVAMTALHHGDPRAVDLCKTLVVGKEKQAAYFCTLFAVMYHLTGDEQYKKAVFDRTDGGKRLLAAADNGDFPATAHWLLTQPPKGK